MPEKSNGYQLPRHGCTRDDHGYATGDHVNQMGMSTLNLVTKIPFWANPTVRGIQQCSKQSFQPHHPGVLGLTPLDFFFKTNFWKNAIFQCKKGIIHSHRDLNSVSSVTDKTKLLGPMPSRLRSPAPLVRKPPRAAASSAGGITSLSLKPAAHKLAGVDHHRHRCP